MDQVTVTQVLDQVAGLHALDKVAGVRCWINWWELRCWIKWREFIGIGNVFIKLSIRWDLCPKIQIFGLFLTRQVNRAMHCIEACPELK